MNFPIQKLPNFLFPVNPFAHLKLNNFRWKKLVQHKKQNLIKTFQKLFPTLLSCNIQKIINFWFPYSNKIQIEIKKVEKSVIVF